MAAKDADALTEMRERYKRASEACADLYDEARADIKFVSKPGCQWDEKLKARRGDRPCYEFPKIQSHIRQVVNEMRQSRPQGKVRGVEESDTGLAEIMQGLVRNIADVSNADLAHDIAFQAAVKGGFGVWRITTDYADEDSFDQCVYIRPVRNPFAVKFDPAANEIDRRDGLFAFVEEFMPESEFERQYPDADLKDFDGNDEIKDWRDAGKIRIAEYWYKKPLKRDLLALSNGDVVWADETDTADLAANGVQVVKQRAVDSHKVYMRLTNGAEFLTDEKEFPSKFIPLIPVWGEIENIDGEDYWQGLTRPSKDQQRLHNVHRTAVIEAVAKSPKAPFITKLKWIKGLERFWKNANAEDYPYLPINDEADGIPQRAQQAEVPTALIQMAAMDNDDIKAATGIFDPSLGAQSNETSGKAINARKQQSAVSTFNFIDNLSYAIRFENEILIDMIPNVYDTPRVVRIIGQDGAEAWKQLYQTVTDAQGNQRTINDISKGKYDIAVTVGPSFATQRMEMAQALGTMIGQIGPVFPPLGALMGYGFVKAQDAPGMDEIVKSARRILVQKGLLQPGPDDQQESQQPDPMQQAQAQKLAADAQYTQARAEKTHNEAQAVLPKAHAEIERDLAEAGHHHTEDALSLVMPQPYAQARPQPPPAGGLNTQGL